MDSIDLSIIVPVYNTQKYIKKCINSIINQSFQKFELICIDDGSTDGSYDVLLKLSEQDKRIKLIHTENKGLVSARKKGIGVAKGDYIAYVDSDDWIEEDMYAELMDIAHTYKADVVTSGYYKDYNGYCVEQKEAIKEGFYEGEELKLLKSSIIIPNPFFSYGIFDSPWNKIYRTALLKKYQVDVPDDLRIGEDTALVYPLILSTDRIYVKEKCYYHYCIRKNSMMSDNGETVLINAHKVIGFLEKKFLPYSEDIFNIKQQLMILSKSILLMASPESVMTKDAFNYMGDVERVVLYGCGKLGNKMRKYIGENSSLQIVSWVDKDPNDKKCEHVESILNKAFDGILIMVLQASLAKDIQFELLKMGILNNKIYLMHIDPTNGEIVWKNGN